MTGFHVDCGTKTAGILGDVIGKDDGTHRGFPGSALAHEQDLLSLGFLLIHLGRGRGRIRGRNGFFVRVVRLHGLQENFSALHVDRTPVDWMALPDKAAL